MIRNSGTEPTIIHYLETPPTRDELVKLIADMGISVRALLRKNVEPYEELGLAEDKFTDDRLIDFMLQHPILINRPIVVTPLGTRLCRPSEVVLEILPDAQKGAFSKEDGEKVVDEVNEAVKKVTENNPSFGYNADGIVSSDIIGTTFGSVFDPTQTQVVGKGDGQVVKVVAWYDNEYGFTSQMIRTLEKFASMI